MEFAMNKLRLKVGDTEIEYEGSKDFSREDIETLLEIIGTASVQQTKNSDLNDDGGSGGNPASGGAKLTEMSTRMIAQKLNAKTAKEVAFAASIRLGLIDGRQSYSRQEILTEMKNAHGHYKSSMKGSNLKSALEGLTKDDLLIEPQSDKFSLTQNGENVARSRLG